MDFDFSQLTQNQKRRLWLVAGILFLLGSGILTFLALWLDDTTYGTGNGLWKAVWIRDYIEKGVDFSHLQELSYVSNLLYFPVYAAISQILPSGLAMVTKMAIINAWFAGLAGAAFYVLAFLLTQNWKAALGGFLFHLAGANFLTCSTNSEDIIPAYAFFVWSLVFLVLYLQRPVYQWLLLTAFCYALSWGFHWTMAIGPAPAFLLALLWRQESWRKALTDLILFATVNLMAITAAWIIFGVPPDLMIYPNKGEGGAWLGFALEKFPLLYSGMALYVLGGFQFNGLEIFLETIQNRWYGPEFVFSSLILIISLLVSIVWWRKKRKVKGVRIFNWYLVALFFFAQLMNVYEFGTDLQFHIQPMIWLPIAWVLLLDSLTSKSWPSWLKTGLSCLIGIAIPLFMLGWNVGKFRLPTQGKDHFYLAQIAKVDEKVEDFSNMFWLTRGWDDFRNWGYAQWGEKFRAHTYVLVDYLADRPDESVKEACARLRETIENELDQGKIVIAGPEIIDREAWEIVDTFSGFGQREKCEALLKTVREEFSREVWVKTEMGNFYRLGRGTSPSAL